MKIDWKQVYIDRIEEIENQIRKMARSKKWTGYKELKEEKIRLTEKVEGMK